MTPIQDSDLGFFSVETQLEVLGTETTHSWDEHLDVITFKFFWSPQLDPGLPSLK